MVIIVTHNSLGKFQSCATAYRTTGLRTQSPAPGALPFITFRTQEVVMGTVSTMAAHPAGIATPST